MTKCDFHKLAELELTDARGFYDELVYGLGKKFILEVEYIVNRIKTNPLEFPICYNNFRKALLRKFPYSVIFRIDDESIYILAIAHQKRKPKYFAKR